MEQSTQIQSKPISSFSYSPKFLGGFLSRSMLDHPVISASPTSILDTKQFCNNNNSRNHPTGYHHKDLVKPSSVEIKHKGIGLALEEEEDFDSFSKPNRKMVLFGAKLKKVQVPEPEIVGPFPSTNNTSDLVDLKSPSDFGIKTKNLQLLHFEFDSSVKSQNCFREGLSLSEMELSEEYTCVMTHGNDPKIIHIFDDMIVETCCGGNLFDGLKNKEEEDGFKTKGNNGNSVELVDFLGFCYTCKVKLGDDKDIYMYRGEKSFCSPECRFQEIMREEDEEDI